MPTRERVATALAESTDSESEFQDAQAWDEEASPEAVPMLSVATGVTEGSEVVVDAADAVRQRTVVDRALAQLFDMVDSLTSARLLFSRYDRDPKNGELDVRSLRAMLQHLGKGQWEYSAADARNVLGALAPGRTALPFAVFQREVQRCLLEALRRRWLAQSFSAHQQGQDWTRLWVLFTKHRSGANRTSSARSGAGPVERLTFAQFESAARKAGFGAHRGQNLKHTAPSSVCGMAANLTDSELKSLFALLVELVQGRATRSSLADDGAGTPATSGLTFEAFLLFMERGCLSANQETPLPRPVSGQGGECASPAARAARWAHMRRELHPHADRVFEKLLKLQSASLRGALLPPDVDADPAKTVPQLTSEQFARRLATAGVELTEDELRLLVAEFGTHNLVGSAEGSINVVDFISRCSTYRRHHHSHETHQRNVLRQRLGQTPPTTPMGSSLGAAATILGASSAADALFSSSDGSNVGVGAASGNGGNREESAPEPESEPQPEPEPEPEPSLNHYLEPRFSSPPQRRSTAATGPSFASPTVSSSKKKLRQRKHGKEHTSSVWTGDSEMNDSASKPQDFRVSSPHSRHGQETWSLRKELADMRAERDEAIAALAQQQAMFSVAATVEGQQTAEQREHVRLKKELAAVKAELSAMKAALHDSRKEVRLLRSHAARLQRSVHTQRESASDMQPDVTQVAADSEPPDSWTEFDLFSWSYERGASSPAILQQKPDMITGQIPFSRQRSEQRSYLPDENSHTLQVKQWVNGLREPLPTAVNSSSSNKAVPTSTRGNKQGQLEQALDKRLEVDARVERASPPPLSVRRGLQSSSDAVVSDTETDSDNTSEESDSDETASVLSKSATQGLPLDAPPRTGALLRARCSVAVRSGFDLASKHIGDLQQGDAIEALEVRRNEATGQYRVRILVALHNPDGSGGNQPPMAGWVNMTTREGTQPLFSRVSTYV